MLSSQTKNIVEQEMQGNTSVLQNDRLSFIKNPAVLEFLGLPENKGYTESDLEQAIINHMQNFLLELGKGFMFVGTQQRITLGNIHYYVDMVFYNKILKFLKEKYVFFFCSKNFEVLTRWKVIPRK